MADELPSILVVDDNGANQRLLDFLLTARGYEVRVASDAAEAVAAIAERLPALILMDVQLPDLDGLTLARQLKADPKTKDVLIIACTANAMKGDEERARAAGCDGYVTKPIDTRTLPVQIADYLRRAKTK